MHPDPASSLHRLLAALERLRGAEPTVDGLLAGAPAAVGPAAGFERVLVSRIRGSRWVPGTLWVAEGEAAAVGLRRYLDAAEIPLGDLHETEVVRRRVPLLVRHPAADPRTAKEIIRATATPGYVMAPVVVGRDVVAVLHADHGTDGREVDEADRDLLHLATCVLGTAIDAVELREQTRTHGDRLAAVLREAADAVTGLAGADLVLGVAAPPTDEAAPAPRRLQRLFTPRELDVLELLAEGASNAEMARQLVIEVGTVKCHVKRILRKLRVENRSQAAVRYAQLVELGATR
jgi:LuxR family transcriptional regulator, regulator of acetate metabolism